MSSMDPGAAIVANLFRASALLSIPVAYALYTPEAAIRFALLFALLLAPRAAGVPRIADAAFCLTLLIATWAGVASWYRSIIWMDEAVHFVTVGAVAATAYFILVALQLLPSPREVSSTARRSTVALLTVVLGLAIATLWEFYEWVGEQFVPAQIIVGYDDTILDLALGGGGALIAGALLMLRRQRRASRTARP